MLFNLQKLSLVCFTSLGLFSVVNFWQYLTPIPSTVLLLLFCSILCCLALIKKTKLNLSYEQRLILYFFIVTSVLSSIGLLFSLDTAAGLYEGYFLNGYFSRIISLLMFILIFINLSNYINKYGTTALIKCYIFVSIIFCFFGVWQWLSFNFGIPFPDFETRTHIHSVDNSFRALFPNRITSIANEPSYLAPILIDTILILLFFLPFKKVNLIYSTLLFIILIFSFSGGGIVNALILIAVFLLLDFIKSAKKQSIPMWFIPFFIISISLIIILINPITLVLSMIIDKLSSASNLSGGVRAFEVIMPFYWAFKDGVISGLFGHGVGSYSTLPYIFTLPSGLAVHGTSNSIYADFVYEIGYVGIFLWLMILFHLTYKSYKLFTSTSNYSLLGPFMMCVHLGVSSLYRADFVTPRFWLILLLITASIHIYSRTKYDC